MLEVHMLVASIQYYMDFEERAIALRKEKKSNPHKELCY